MKLTPNSLLASFILASFLALPQALAAPKAPLPRKEKSADSTSPSSVLWDHWYTVTVSDKTLQIYNEHAEIKQNRVFVKYSSKKKEEDFVNEENMGLFAENNNELTPLFFNFHSNYRSTETQIDGTVTGGQLQVKIHRGDQELTPVKRGLPSKVIFSTMFTVWLGKHLSELAPGKSLSFQSILEDQFEGGYSPMPGVVKVMSPDDVATKLQAKKLLVTQAESEGVWWVDTQGAILKMEMPAIQTIVQRVPKEKAEKYFAK